MRKLLIFIFVLLTTLVFSQTNATFNNLDIRNLTRLRGKVGIGITNPVEKLEVRGNIALDSGQTRVIFVNSNTPNAGNNLVIMSGFGNTGMTSFGGNLYLYSPIADTPGNVILQADTNGTFTGYVGVGIATPQELLDINGGIKWREVDTVNIENPIVIWDSSDSTLNVIEFDSLTGLIGSYWTRASGDLYPTTITDSVGIGTATPTEMLDVQNGNINIDTTSATVGQIKQAGVTVFHTYTDNVAQPNLFIGKSSGNLTTTGNYNVSIGDSSLYQITTALYNVSVGFQAGLALTESPSNTLMGFQAGKSITAGASVGMNTFIGKNAGLLQNSEYSVAIGANTLDANTGGYNTAVGGGSIGGTGTGIGNSTLGYGTLGSNTNGAENVAVGYSSNSSNTTGNYNISIGSGALLSNKINSGSVAIGYNAMYYADSRTTSGRTTYNTAVGYEAMKGSATAANNTGQYNTAVGYQALDAMTSGDSNTVIGVSAGGAITTGQKNVLLGFSAGSALTTESNKLYIENSNSATPLIWGDFALDSVIVNGDLNYGDTYWKDATVSAYSLAGGVNAPSLVTIKAPVSGMGFNFQTANDIAYGQAQMNHDYKLGTDIEAHVHWLIDQAPAGGNDTIAIAFSYTWADIGEVFPTATTDTTLIVVNSSTEFVHYLTELASPITGSGGDGLSSVIAFSIERLQNYSKDTYPSWWVLLDVDFHHQIDSPGSDDELIK